MKPVLSSFSRRHAFRVLLIAGASAGILVNYPERRPKPASAPGADRFIAQANRLRAGLGLGRALIVTDSFRFVPRTRGRIWWTIEGRLPNGNDLFTVWDEATGELRFMSWLKQSAVILPAKEISKNEAVSNARFYSRGAFRGTPFTHGRLETASYMQNSWRLEERIWGSSDQPARTVRVDIDSHSGRLLGMRVDH